MEQKKEYISPEVEVVKFNNLDIITTSIPEESSGNGGVFDSNIDPDW